MITYNMIFHLNAALSDAGLPFKVAFKNEETAIFEGLGHCASSGREEEFSDFVITWFLQEGVAVSVTDPYIRVCRS